MEVKLNYIYRVPSLNMLARVSNISGNEVRFVNGVTVDKKYVDIALPKNTKLKNTTTGEIATVSVDIEAVSEFTKIPTDTGDINMFSSQYRPRWAAINFPADDETVKDSNVILGEMEDYIGGKCGLPYSIMALNKIYSTYEKNKQRLKEILSHSPYWNEENLCLDWVIEVPNRAAIDDAELIFNRIWNRTPIEQRSRLRLIWDLKNFRNFLNIDSELSTEFKKYGLHIQSGMKPTRALHKFYEETGITKIPDFEKMFAELSDCLSTKTIKRRITLSIHPLDFLRVSEGNSWTSCHNIRERGCYCNGALSYLMDEQSMVCSLLDVKSEEKPYLQGKINRMMFFLNEDGDILQSRLYPKPREAKPRDRELEDFLAHEINKKISECLKVADTYNVAVSDVCCGDYVISRGVHYRDYECANFGQRIWTRHDHVEKFKIGHESYCVKCGEVNTYVGSVVCSCGRCHESITNDLFYVCPNSGKHFYLSDHCDYNKEDGKYYSEYYLCAECGEVFFDKPHKYCPECRVNMVCYCDNCGETDETIEYICGNFYCKDCKDEFFEICTDCGKLVSVDDLTRVDSVGNVCSECLSNTERYFYCEDCEEYYSYNEEDYWDIESHGRVCTSCRESGDYQYCDCCGYTYYEEDTCWVPSEERCVCNDCIDNNYFRCDRCEEYFHNDYGTDIGYNRYCSDCLSDVAFECERCGYYYDIEDAVLVGDEYYCEDCADRISTVCDGCGERFYDDDVVWDETEQGNYCERCAGELEEERQELQTDDDSNEEPEVADTNRIGVMTESFDDIPVGARVELLGVPSDAPVPDSDVLTVSFQRGHYEYFRYVPRALIKFEEE